MNKALKIGGIVLGVFIIIVFVINISRSFFGGMLSGSNSSFSGIELMDTAGQGTSFNNSLSAGSSRSQKMIAPSSSSVTYEADSSQNISQTDKKIIKNGDLSLKVDKVDDAVVRISSIARGNGGELFSSNLYQNGSNVKNGSVTVKIPVANFENTFNEIKKVASLVIRESTSGQDVTEQYADLQAQLRNRQAEEQSFVRILDQAQKIEDVLAVTRELARVRGSIEQLQGSMKYLESQTDMSIISVSITEDANVTIANSWRPFQVLKESFNSLIGGLQGFVDLVIRFFIVVLPFLIIWGVIIWVAYKVARKIYIRMKSGKQEN